MKSTLLDILLLRASGWKAEEDSDEQETASELTEDEVFIEDDVTEEQQYEETGDQDDSEGKIARGVGEVTLEENWKCNLNPCSKTMALRSRMFNQCVTSLTKHAQNFSLNPLLVDRLID